MNTAARHNAWSLELQRTTLLGLDGTQTINGVPERVHHTTEEALTHRNRKHLAGPGHLLACFDATEFTEDNHTNLVLVQVLGQTQCAISKLHQLVGHTSRQPLDVGDTVRCIHHVAHLGGCGGTRVIRTRELVKSVADFLRVDRNFCHGSSFCWVFGSVSRSALAGQLPSQIL